MRRVAITNLQNSKERCTSLAQHKRSSACQLRAEFSRKTAVILTHAKGATKASLKKRSTPHRRIWRAVERIPRGRVASYGQIARLCGLPGQARLVGYALHALPHAIEIPWQRVVTAQGRIAFPAQSQSYYRQKMLLEQEGIVFAGDKIDLKKYGWKK